MYRDSGLGRLSQIDENILVLEDEVPEVTMTTSVNYSKLIRPYNGETDFTKFIENFEEISTAAGWDDNYKLLLLKSKCIGKALAYLDVAIPSGTKVTYNELKKLLTDEFKPHEKLIVRLRRFQECTQRYGESVTVYAARVRAAGIETCETEDEKKLVGFRLLAQF